MQIDIDSHKPSIDNINKAAAKMLQTSEPSMARAIKGKLDSLNSRFEHLKEPVNESCDVLQQLSDQLGRLQEEVDGLEDWLIPTLETLESPDISRMELSEVGAILQVKETCLEDDR